MHNERRTKACAILSKQLYIKINVKDKADNMNIRVEE